MTPLSHLFHKYGDEGSRENATEWKWPFLCKASLIPLFPNLIIFQTEGWYHTSTQILNQLNTYTARWRDSTLFFFFPLINDNNLLGNPHLLLPTQMRARTTFSARTSHVWWIIQQGLLPSKKFPSHYYFLWHLIFLSKVFFDVKLFLVSFSGCLLSPKIYVLNPSQQFCSFPRLPLPWMIKLMKPSPAFPPTKNSYWDPRSKWLGKFKLQFVFTYFDIFL